MNTMILGSQNLVLAGSVTASASVAGMGPNQLQNDQGNAAAALQIPSTTGSVTVAIAGYSAWRAFGLFRTNLTPDAVVTWSVIYGFVGTIYTGTSSAVVPGFGQTVLAIPSTPAPGSAVRVDISDPTNPDGFLNIPLMYAGPAWQPARNMDYQSSPGRASQNTRAMTRAGGVITRSDWVKRTYDLSLSAIQQGEMTQLYAADLAGRQGGNVLFVPDPASATISQEAIFGELEPTSGVTYPYQGADARAWRARITERL